MLACPICAQALKQAEKRFYCENGHSFDCAKSGYVHLLPTQQKHTKTPGDNKLMVTARSRFLDKDYYAPMADSLCHMAVNSCMAAGLARPNVLDAGCGEGYYTARLYKALRCAELCPDMVGIDISKIALDKAAKREKAIGYGVGSVFHLPIQTEGADLLVSLFAPYCGGEYHRVLRPGGAMLLVIPGRDHLWQLKQALYEKPYKNSPKPYELPGFALMQRQTVSGVIDLQTAQDIADLFMMTPYYYKTGADDQKRLLALTALLVQTEFELLLYKKA